MIILMVAWVEFAPENIDHKINFFMKETVCGVTWQNICMEDFFCNVFTESFQKKIFGTTLCTQSGQN
jgi:hypothetical protein